MLDFLYPADIIPPFFCIFDQAVIHARIHDGRAAEDPEKVVAVAADHSPLIIRIELEYEVIAIKEKKEGNLQF